MHDIFQQAHPSFLRIPSWEMINPSIVAGFTTRAGGYSDPPYDTFNVGLHVQDNYENIIKNRKKLAEILAFPLNNWIAAEQIHHANIQVIDHLDKGKGVYDYNTSIKGVDGLITNETGILCTMFFADCVPLYFYDPVTGYIGIAHAGWKGTTKKIAMKMVDELQRLGVKSSNLLALIGPSISQEKYEVDKNVINQIDKSYLEKVTIKSKENHYFLDLKQLNKEILLDSGLDDKNIKATDLCTYKEETLFFSHRRDEGKTGRMLGFIGFQA